MLQFLTDLNSGFSPVIIHHHLLRLKNGRNVLENPLDWGKGNRNQKGSSVTGWNCSCNTTSPNDDFLGQNMFIFHWGKPWKWGGENCFWILQFHMGLDAFGPTFTVWRSDFEWHHRNSRMHAKCTIVPPHKDLGKQATYPSFSKVTQFDVNLVFYSCIFSRNLKISPPYHRYNGSKARK